MKSTQWLAMLSVVASALGAQYPAALQQGAAEATTATQAAQILRTHYFHQDFATGVDLAKDFMRQFPRSAEVRAWQVVNLARVFGSESAALAIADSASLWPSPNDRWRQFARSFALSYDDKGADSAIAIAKRLRRTSPWDPELLWLHGYVLHRATKYADAVALMDSAIKAGTRTADLLVIKANAQASLSRGVKPDSVMRAAAIATFAEARSLDPGNLNAYYLYIANLNTGRTDTTMFEPARRAASLTPAINVHQFYWGEIRKRREYTSAQRDSMISADIDALLAARPRSSAVLRAAWREYGQAKRGDLAERMYTRLRSEHPESVDLDWVEYDRINAIADSARETPADSAALMLRFRQALAARVARGPRDRSVFSNLVMSHYHASVRNDTTLPLDSLRKFADLVIEYNRINPHTTHLDLPLLVVERGGHFSWAEKIVREGDSLRRVSTERLKEFLVRDQGVGAYADRLDALKASTHGALAFIHVSAGRLDDADRELKQALHLNKRDPLVHYTAGKLAEKRGQPVEAQAAYARGFQFESSFTGWKNRNALRTIYASNNGSMDGFDAYIERLKNEDRARRKAKIASERFVDARPLVPFSLAKYGDEKTTVTDDALKGKVGVVNFWGVWCGPCVKEIPDIQKFHDAVKNDTNVVFLTVDYNDTPETLDEFMKKRKLTFPVIIDADRWASDKALINAYPTTLFIGRDGKIAWKHIGASDVVFEEFMWRVEMLKGGAVVP